MAIQLIDTATPQVGLKGGAAKINANFTDSENAASRLVQSSPTDTTDGALMAVGAFGLGGDAMPSVDWNDPQTTQAIVSNVNGPNGAIGFLGFNTKSGGNSVAFAGRNSEFYARTIQDGTPQAWQPVYTGSNLNPNEFGGLASGDVIAIGYAESATIAVFNLPISSTTAPSSVTITGTFEIRAGAGFTARATGISSGSFVTPATTSNKYFVLGITGLSGLTIGETLLLRTESASSKITVNL